MLEECKDKELIATIKKESQEVANQLPALETALLKSLMPRDAYDQVWPTKALNLSNTRRSYFLPGECHLRD
jgi:hypothetical protein